MTRCLQFTFILIFTLGIFTHFNVNAQTPKLDSLKTLLANEKSIEGQTDLLIKICSRNFSLPADTFYYYIKNLQQLVIPGSPEYFKAQIFYCFYLSKKGETERSAAIADSLSKVIPNDKKYQYNKFSLVNFRAGLNVRSNKSKEAIEDFLNSLLSAEELRDTIWVLRACSGLSYAYMELGQWDEAVKWSKKGIAYTNDENILQQIGLLFSNCGSSMNNLNMRDSALYYVNRALKYGRQDENFLVIANSLNIRAAIYEGDKNYKACEADLQEALAIRAKNYNMDLVVSDMAQLSFFYANTNQEDKGIEIAKKGIGLIKGRNQFSKLIFLNKALAENYKSAGKYQEYSQTLLRLLQFTDSLNELNSHQAIAELETKYELQKKENIIIQQENKIVRNRYVTIGTIVLVIFLAVLLVLIYRNRQLVRMRKMESQLVQQKILAVEEVKLARENERKRIAADLHDNLGSFAASISSNVKYLREGTLNKDVIISQLDDNAQSMVTQLSDTIWVLKNEHLPITKLADRFKVWMQRLIQNYPEVTYHYSENIINDVEFTPAKILHIFLILKECVTNALRHSGATDLKISFISESNWTISIEDNGKGISNSDMEKVMVGNGINNIKRRALENNWSVTWEPSNANGTNVIISDRTTK